MTGVATPSPRAIAAKAGDIELTGRHVQWLERAALGMTNRRIGAELYLAEDTVKTVGRVVMRKLGARDRTHAVAIAIRLGLISRGPEAAAAVSLDTGAYSARRLAIAWSGDHEPDAETVCQAAWAIKQMVAGVSF